MPRRERPRSRLISERPRSGIYLPEGGSGSVDQLRPAASVLSLEDDRYAKARLVTSYLAGAEGKHLLHQNKEMAGSVGKLSFLLSFTLSALGGKVIFRAVVHSTY